VGDAPIDILGPEGAAAARRDGDRVLVHCTGFEALTGWQTKAAGLCRGDVCIPLPLELALDDQTIARDGELDLTATCEIARMPFVVDDEANVGVVGTAAAERSDALADRLAPRLELTDLDGRRRVVPDPAGGKTMFVAFASWCGCALDLPGWQLVADELTDEEFTLVGVAVDESADLVRPFAEDVRFPIVLDPDREFCERYGVVNVPTVVWIDADGTIARPNLQAFADDLWFEVHGKRSGPHLDDLRRWVRDDVLPDVDVDAVRPTTSHDQQRARAEFRLALELRRRRLDDRARAHFERATELAPDDFTIWRAALQLTGGDPFGPEFFARYDDWKERTGGFSYPGDLPPS
jgi:peroxiredoxin